MRDCGRTSISKKGGSTLHEEAHAMMYSRKVSFNLKPDGFKDFNLRQEKEIVPILRKQKGFQEVITMVTPDKKHVEAISLWDRMEDVEAYDRSGYKDVVKVLASVVEGTPKVETMEVAASTILKAAR
jgi:heme-degrading monooxygenase HmoA